MAQGLNDIFGGQDQYMDEVIILSAGQYTSGTYSVPAGYTWSDFEYIEMFSTASTSNALGRTVQVGMITKELIAANTVDWSIQNRSTGSSETATIDANSATSFVISRTGNDAVTLVKGYIKRYSSRNMSKVINVNGGADVTNNKRYEIDITSELGADYVGRDLIVKAEIYNDSGTGVAGWGNSDFITIGNLGHGVAAHVLNGKIVVQTGVSSLCANSNNSGNPFNRTGTITSAPCRVKVWKIDQYITNTAGSGGAGITELWAGSVGNNTVIPINDSLSKYDMIQVEGTATMQNFGSAVSTAQARPATILGNGKLSLSESANASGSQYTRLGVDNITESSMTAFVEQAGSGWVGKITSVIGINYGS